MSPDTTEPPRIGYLVARVDRMIRVRMAETLDPFGLTIPQYTVLSVIARRSGLSNAQLARRAYVSPQAMHQVIRGLEQDGLVVRTSSPDHGKIRPAALTRRGEAVLTGCDEAVDELEREMFGSLGAGGRSDLRRLLESCVAASVAG